MEPNNGLTDSSNVAPPVPASFATLVSAATRGFTADVRKRLATGHGEPEDQMRGPLEGFLRIVGEALGIKITPVGEASLSDLKVRPDYAIDADGAICGYIEVKAPGKGADPTVWKTGSHDRLQWEKLRVLPNVLYTDGNFWGLYRDGLPVGELARLDADLRTPGEPAAPAGDGLARLLAAFLTWEPVQPRSVNQLVHSVAGLTRLLRDEIVDTLAREARAGSGPFTSLAEDWRDLLFPDAESAEFADGYAQTLTFALLLARNEGIDFTGLNVDEIAKRLGKTHSLMGKALAVLTDESIGALSVTLGTLVRVVGVVDWAKFEKQKADPYLYLYERFLEEYDPELRKRSGSYYTPHSVVSAMTRLADDVLRTRLGKTDGLASDGVTVVDPAMGTGAYILEVIERAAATIEKDLGTGAVPAYMRSFASRVIGFEKQLGPFAVAELRAAEAFRRHDAVLPDGGLRLYVTDTLDNPFVEQTQLGSTYEAIARSRRNASKVKATEPVLLVIGNPPYGERAKGKGAWIEEGDVGTGEPTPLDAFREPGNGKAEYVLSNLYVFFWRWATWKVFDAHESHPAGVVCFITTAGYLNGPGFKGMRRYLRGHADEGWIVDCTPEGHQPPVNTRIFPGVQQPLAIAIFMRRGAPDPSKPAVVHFARITGLQEEKFEMLHALTLDAPDWQSCPEDWTAVFLPAGGDLWSNSPLLGDLMPWQLPGVAPHRTWVYAPNPETLKQRWRRLVEASDKEKPSLFRDSRDATLAKKKPGLHGFPHANVPFKDESSEPPEPVKISYRSFDEQWLIPDDRLLDTPRPPLWMVRGDHQTYTTELHSESPRLGPGLTFAAHVPDMHHFKGSGGGRALPLYRDATGSTPNVAPGLLDLLASHLCVEVDASDLLAYIAAIASHPAYTSKFADELVTPGIRVPLTADRQTWEDAVKIGREVLWLHTKGQRFADASVGRPSGAPRVLDDHRAPKVVVPIPDTPDEMPDSIDYVEATHTLSVGNGKIAPVDPRVIAYSVSTTNILRKWFGYRLKTRQGANATPLDDVRPDRWSTGLTKELIDLLHVLTRVVDLEAEQKLILERVVTGPMITVEALTEAQVLPVPEAARSGPSTNPSAKNAHPDQQPLL